MNDWNSLENQMRGWTPRSPSARVRARLFPAPEAGRNGAWLGGRSWLAPAAVVGLLLFSLAGERFQPPASPVPGGPGGRLIAAALSNQSYAPFFAGATGRGLNAPVLELPKASRLSSSLGSFQILKTNSLLY